MTVGFGTAGALSFVCGYAGYIDPKFPTLTSVSVSNRVLKDGTEATEWRHISFSDPKEGREGFRWAEFAAEHITRGTYIAAVCYRAANGQYTNYYVRACCTAKDGMLYKNGGMSGIAGHVENVSATGKNGAMAEVTVDTGSGSARILFAKGKPAADALAFRKGMFLSCVATDYAKDGKTFLIANAYEAGPFPKKKQ